MEAKINNDILQKIGSFLSYQEQGQFAQVGIFARDLVREMHSIDAIAALKIQELPVGSLKIEQFNVLLVQLVTLPGVGHPKHWVPAMDSLMRSCPVLDTSDNVTNIIESHTQIAALLSQSNPPISNEAIYQFCTYLGLKQLSQTTVWIAYRVFEQYMLKLQPINTGIKRALKEYLTKQADTHIQAKNNCLNLNSNISFQEADIDPRIWFGWNKIKDSLWEQPDTENVQIPEVLLEVLWTRIQVLHKSCSKDQYFMVSISGRAEASLPYNFTLSLAQRITKEKIFFDHEYTIDTEKLEEPYYGKSIQNLNQHELKNLRQKYTHQG